jgi:hypothetical protein
MVPNGDRIELVSWKEIAGYLGVGVRTAQVWERERGLPVRRLPGPRGQVSALVADLKAWKSSGNLPPTPEAPRRRAHWWWAAPLLAVVLSASAFVVWSRPGQPSRYRVEPHTLIISDDRGRELWRKHFASLDEASYSYADNKDGIVWFGDLDGNGATSVVFLLAVGRSGAPESVIAYTSSGRERWRFTPGHAVHTSTKAFQPPFHPERFLVTRLGRQGRLRVAVTSTDHMDDPCRVALLDKNGRLLREYWHSGHLTHLLAMDLDHQGWNTLIAAGISNAHKAGTLLVLDPDHFTGASNEDDPAYQLRDLPPGVEAARILFPRSCINEKLEPFTTVTRLWRDGETIGLEVQHRLSPPDATIFYHLNLDLTLNGFTVGTSFERAHLALQASGIIDHELSQAEIAAFRNLSHLTVEDHAANH